ncbi:MAG: Gfo/Idh/MocA family protein [Spirochaetota bacterium]
MDLLIVGSGGFTQKHAGILSEMDDVRVAGFCSRSADHAGAAARALEARTGGPVGAFTDLREALDRTTPDAAVIVVTPDGHGEIELELVSRGIPFLVEKPIGIEAKVPQRIAEAVEQAGLVTSVGFHMRYLDTTAAFATMLRATTTVMANGYWMSTLPPPSWWRHASESGGQFVEQTIHMIDLMRVLFGEAESVYAATARRAISELHADADVPDSGTAVVRMQSGLVVTLLNSCLGPRSMRVGFEAVTPVALFRFSPQALIVERANETTETRPALDPYRAQDAAFIEAVRTGDASGIRSPYADALRSHRVSMAIVESVRTGLPVEL